MRIIGIDPGSIITGFGVIDHEKGRLSLVDQGCIRTKKGAELPARLHQIFLELTAVISRTTPIAAAIESPFHGSNTKSLIQLAHARGVVLLAVQSAGLDVFEYSPRSVKSAVVGYGAAEKQQIEKMVRLLIGANGTRFSPDAADAIAVAICHAHSAKMIAR